MDHSKPTLAIYAVQDRSDSDTPYFVHDHAITLMEKGNVIKHLTFERLSRLKHDNKLHRSLYQVLKDEKLLKDDFDLVFPDNVVGRAMISSCGKLRYEGPLNEFLYPHIEKGKCWWLDHERSAYSINHELAHIGSCLPFYQQFKENSLLVHFDGGGSLSNFSAWQYKDGKLTSLEYHWNLKYLSSFFNANALVFGIIGAKFNEQNSVPGKMMGLAAYGQYSKPMEEWLVKNDYFANCWGSKAKVFESIKKHFVWNENQLSTQDCFMQDVLATLQHIFIRELKKELNRLQQHTGAAYLYYTGGSALNIVANKDIVDSAMFKDVFIPPCPEDSGLSLGAAAFVEWQKHGTIARHSPYLNNWALQKNVLIDSKELDSIAQQIVAGKVIGICNDFGEIGPRALGNRSIIARADNKQLAEKVSMAHKGREWYRPVAPIMMEENAKYFTGQDQIHHLADYMLIDLPVLYDQRKQLEGAVHIDGTARIQTIRNKEQNPFMYALLLLLHEKYQIKALINTSFNKRGEPIVHSHEDAIKSAKNMSLDGVVLDGKWHTLT